MNDDLALLRFGIPASPENREEIISALEEAVANVRLEKEDAELIRCLSVQLMSIGEVQDCMLIWRAKCASFDLRCGMDIEFLCGAGLDATLEYLRNLGSKEAKEALDYLSDTVEAGGFAGWSVAAWIEKYRKYYGVDS